MDSIFAWDPLLWTIRVAVLIVVGGLGFAALLLFFRLLKPRNALALASGGIPSVKSLGLKGSLFGTELEANAVLDTARDAQLWALRDGLLDLTRRVEAIERREDGEGWK